MKKSKLIGLGVAALCVGLLAAGCGGKKSGTGTTGSGDASGGTDKKSDFSIALITDTGGVDDRSFNQSAWQGMEKWGKDNGLAKGVGGYNYYQSTTEADYTVNADQAVTDGFNLIYGIGYKLKPTISKAADSNPDTNFVIIDDTITGKDNVVSATFKDNEASYLAGVAAAKSTKTRTVGFIGGEQSEVIDRFEAGFVAGVKSVDEKIEVLVQYAGSFGAPDKGKTVAAGFYNKGADIIFHASGGTGVGVFAEAIARDKALPADSDEKVWVIGVDLDQTEQGNYKSKDGKDANLTLTSTLKAVDAAVIDMSTKAKDGKFPGGEHLDYGLKEDGVGLSDGNLTDDVKKAVEDAKQQIIDGKITVPETPEKK